MKIFVLLFKERNQISLYFYRRKTKLIQKNKKNVYHILKSL